MFVGVVGVGVGVGVVVGVGCLFVRFLRNFCFLLLLK